MNLLNRFCSTEFSSYEDFYSNFKINIPDNFNFGFDIVDEYAALAPQQKALLWCNDKGEERTFTFSDISRLSNKAANVFAKYGVAKGDTVMLILKRRHHFWYCLPGLIKLGAIAIPSTHMLTEQDIDYRVGAAEIKYIVCANDKNILGHVKKVTEKNPEITVFVTGGNENAEEYVDFDAELNAADDTAPARVTENNDPMLIYFTSGTTAHPKMVQHVQYYPLGHILTAGFWQNLKDTDTHFTLADTGWAKCAWGKIFGQWICGACVFVYDYDDRFAPTDILHVLSTKSITTFCAPPTVYRFLIKEDLKQYDLSNLRACYIAGEPLNAVVYEQWLAQTGIELREGFGQSESPVIIATFPWLTPKPGSTGRPSPVLGMHLLDDNGNDCGVGEEGEICIDISHGIPPGVFHGYRADDEATANVMYNGWYHTGDMAWKDEDGYLWFVGRSDDVIKSSGYRIGPFEVESALLEHPAVLETAITAVPDPERGQIVKATVVLAKGYVPSPELTKELQNHVKRVTAPYKYPRIIEYVSELPKTISGKIKRKQIRTEDANRK
ncbi:MAG: AMP-binding protein [Clostridia bacterium]|nr:AMP-binding protein [Clostridia bacterium]